ncbi:MAG TPA: GAF domain-containing sensor histidine kinase [Chthonomonadaceae bacterium]|nr:GAF domain-containing sensor histidine kinase [Chthonomonadaceae bacterium]
MKKDAGAENKDTEMSRMPQTTPATTDSSDYLQTLLQLGQTLNSSLDLKQVLETSIEQVITFVGAERGFILLVDIETGRVWGEAVRNIEKAALEDTLSERDETNRAEISRTLVDYVLDNRQPVISHNAMEDPRFSARQSVQLSHLRSVLCVPLMVQTRLLGIIYLDNRVKSGLFTDRHLAMLSAFANQAAVAIENARLYENLRRSLEDRLRLQDELYRQETQRLALEEAGRLKSEFVGFVAHELSNPLTTIRGYIQTLMADPQIEPAMRDEFYEAIEADADRLLDMIHELLDVSRLEAGRPLTLHVKTVALVPLIEKQIRRHRIYKYFTRDHTLDAELAPDLPETIEADEEKINHIVANLLSNAIKYSPKGGRTMLKAAPDGPEHIVLTVVDEGVGLSKADQQRLFRKYERMEREEIRKIPGTGLGLFLVKHLVDLHGGEIACESVPDQGAMFRVRLPVHPPSPSK